MLIELYYLFNYKSNFTVFELFRVLQNSEDLHLLFTLI